MLTEPRLRYTWIVVIAAAAVCLLSCSDDDPTGPESPINPIPMSDGTTLHYQYIENASPDGTCDVLIETVPAKSAEPYQTRWIFDYHGTFDTLYSIVGTDSVIQYIGIVPPPDTGFVRLEDDRIIFEDFPFFVQNPITIELPLKPGKTWDIYRDNWQYRYQYQASVTVTEQKQVSIAGHQYDASKVEMVISGTSSAHSWNELYMTMYISPGIGIVGVYNVMYDEVYPNSRFVGMLGWELLQSE